jgi:adenylate kinase family enzyme
MEKQRVVIVVGPDMTGKTQIAKELAKRLQVPYFKASSEHHAFMNEPDKFVKDIRYADPRLVDFIAQTSASVVMDRGFPCEWTYATMFGRETDYEAIARIDQAYNDMGANVIFCFRMNGFAGIEDDLDPTRLTSEKLDEIQEMYKKYALNHIRCRRLLLYVDDENLDREVTDVLKFLGV